MCLSDVGHINLAASETYSHAGHYNKQHIHTTHLPCLGQHSAPLIHRRLKPRASKTVTTVTSVFHLHNIRSSRELVVQMNGQRLRHDPHPVYLGVTLDHLTRTAAKLQSHNNQITKLAGTSWGACASTHCMSALALCYSVTEYCCPMWARSSYTSLIDTQLHSSMCLISGCLHSTLVS